MNIIIDKELLRKDDEKRRKQNKEYLYGCLRAIIFWTLVLLGIYGALLERCNC